MEIPLSTGLAILAFFVVIGPLIFFHELGHFVAARLNKVTVEEFGIGLPPRMLTLFERGGTKFTLNWLPLGGFMRPAGEDDPTVPGGLAASSKIARFTVLVAGPSANIVVAFILLVIMFITGAPEDLPGARIVQVEPDSPAANAGLAAGDVILSADNQLVQHYTDLIQYIQSHTGQQITLKVERGSSTLELAVTPRTTWPEGQGPTGIQVEPITEIRHYGFFPAIGQSFEEFGNLLGAFVQFPTIVKRVIEGEIPARYVRPVSVVGISQLGGRAIDTSLQLNAAWPVLQLASFISVALAITNLLPLPALDGGRILFVMLEAIRGRRVDPRRETAVHFVGFAILLVAMLVFMYLDFVDPLVTP